MSQRERVVGVVGGSQVCEEVQAQAEALGRAIAEEGWVLVNGGRAAGVMAASARGARQAGGLVVGILPGRGEGDGPVAEGVDVAVFTGMGDARNAVNVLTSDVVVALPGGAGTLSEVALALKAGKQVVLVGWEAPDPVAGTGEDGLVQVEDVARAVETLRAWLG